MPWLHIIEVLTLLAKDLSSLQISIFFLETECILPFPRSSSIFWSKPTYIKHMAGVEKETHSYKFNWLSIPDLYEKKKKEKNEINGYSKESCFCDLF